jgi:hypothetical protein
VVLVVENNETRCERGVRGGNNGERKKREDK